VTKRVELARRRRLGAEAAPRRATRIFGVAAIVLAVVGVRAHCPGEAEEPRFSSAKPLHAFVAVNENRTKILSLVFDESKGTGEGYDRIYADLNFNGDLTDDRVIEGSCDKQGDMLTCLFPEVDLAVPYKGEGPAVSSPCQLKFTSFERRRESGVDRSFSLEAKIRLKGEGGDWEYPFRSVLATGEKPVGTLVSVFGGTPIMIVQARPDQERKGHIVVGAFLVGEYGLFTCTRDGKPITARVRVRDDKGKEVYSDDVSFDRLGQQGPIESSTYSFPLPPGKHCLEVTVDTGPLAGTLTTKKILVVD
jgi:hypothetical protein